MSNYLEVARIGKNEWWRYLISFPAILVTWFIVGSIPVILLITSVSMDGDPATSFSGAGFAGGHLRIYSMRQEKQCTID